MSVRISGSRGPRRAWIGLAAWALCAGLVAAVGGCTNAVYFYQTDKFSFTAEGRPDASAPLQANLGIKQRVVLVVPPGEPVSDNKACTCPSGTETCACGKSAAALGKKEPTQDAVSVISYFDFWKQPPKSGRSFLDSRFTIHSSFLTGAAADEVGKIPGLAARAALAIAGAPSLDVTDLAIYSLIYEKLKEYSTTDKSAKQAVSYLDRLVVFVPEALPVTLFATTTASEGVSGDAVMIIAHRGEPFEDIGDQGFGVFVRYVDALRDSSDLHSKEPVEFVARNGGGVVPFSIAQFKMDTQEAKAERARVLSAAASTGALDQALEVYTQLVGR